MNRALRLVPGIKDTTVKRYHYDSRAELKSLLNDFISACNFGRQFKSLTLYEFICKQSTIEPEQSNFDPIFQMPGLDT